MMHAYGIADSVYPDQTGTSLLLLGAVSSGSALFEPRCEKTGLSGFQPGPT